MRAFLRYLRGQIRIAMEDFSNDHSCACVSSCGVVYFEPRGTNGDPGIKPDMIAPLWTVDRFAFHEAGVESATREQTFSAG